MLIVNSNACFKTSLSHQYRFRLYNLNEHAYTHTFNYFQDLKLLKRLLFNIKKYIYLIYIYKFLSKIILFKKIFKQSEILNDLQYGHPIVDYFNSTTCIVKTKILQ